MTNGLCGSRERFPGGGRDVARWVICKQDALTSAVYHQPKEEWMLLEDQYLDLIERGNKICADAGPPGKELRMMVIPQRTEYAMIYDRLAESFGVAPIICCCPDCVDGYALWCRAWNGPWRKGLVCPTCTEAIQRWFDLVDRIERRALAAAVSANFRNVVASVLDILDGWLA